jgi:hypothetical protein
MPFFRPFLLVWPMMTSSQFPVPTFFLQEIQPQTFGPPFETSILRFVNFQPTNQPAGRFQKAGTVSLFPKTFHMRL